MAKSLPYATGTEVMILYSYLRLLFPVRKQQDQLGDGRQNVQRARPQGVEIWQMGSRGIRQQEAAHQRRKVGIQSYAYRGRRTSTLPGFGDDSQRSSFYRSNDDREEDGNEAIAVCLILKHSLAAP